MPFQPVRSKQIELIPDWLPSILVHVPRQAENDFQVLWAAVGRVGVDVRGGQDIHRHLGVCHVHVLRSASPRLV